MNPAHIVLIPLPVRIEWGTGEYSLTSDTLLSYSPKCESHANYFAAKLRKATAFPMPTFPLSAQKSPGPAPGISITLHPPSGPPLPPEGYTLKVTPTGIELVGNDAAGCFYGIVAVKK